MLMMGKGDASAPLSCWLGSFHPSFMAQYSLVVVLVFDNLLNGRHEESQKWLGATERKASERASKQAKQQNSSVSAFFSFVPSFIHSLKESDST
jgi:hypothetical protein